MPVVSKIRENTHTCTHKHTSLKTIALISTSCHRLVLSSGKEKQRFQREKIRSLLFSSQGLQIQHVQNWVHHSSASIGTSITSCVSNFNKCHHCLPSHLSLKYGGHPRLLSLYHPTHPINFQELLMLPQLFFLESTPSCLVLIPELLKLSSSHHQVY